jgi:hypothetical protein
MRRAGLLSGPVVHVACAGSAVRYNGAGRAVPVPWILSLESVNTNE